LLCASRAFPAAHISTATLSGTFSASSIASTTFKLRIGPLAAATFYLNGFGGARKFGGVMYSSLSVFEIAQ
jgi:hypothetical protein